MRVPFAAPLVFVTMTACGGGAAGGTSVPIVAASATPVPVASPTPNALSVPSAPGAATVQFAGYSWRVRSDYGGPGPNQFSAKNVWVDGQGFLHLAITNANGVWSTAEVVLQQSLGFGSYQFQILGHPEAMDEHVVLGLFNYTTPSIGPDGTNEIDIEFATWSGTQPQHANWTVWPAIAGPPQSTDAFDASPNTGLSTHRFVWGSRAVAFQAMSGLTNDTTGMYANWTYAPSDYLHLIPQTAEPVHMNLWLTGGPPANGQGQEIVITGFSFTPG